MQTTCPDGLFQGDRPLQISTQIAMNMIAADLRQWLEDKGKTQRGASVAVTNRSQRASFAATPVDELLKVVNQNLPGATVERLTCDLDQLVRFWGMPLSANDRTFLHGIDALRVSFPPTLHEWVSIKVHQAWGRVGLRCGWFGGLVGGPARVRRHSSDRTRCYPCIPPAGCSPDQ